MLCKRDLPVLKSAEYGSASSIQEAESVRRLILLTKDLDLQERVVSLNKQILEQRGSYGKSLLILVIVQVIIINLVFVLVGSHVLTIEPDVFKTFVIAVFVEVVGLPLIVTKSLFRTAKENAT